MTVALTNRILQKWLCINKAQNKHKLFLNLIKTLHQRGDHEKSDGGSDDESDETLEEKTPGRKSGEMLQGNHQGNHQQLLPDHSLACQG